MVFPRWIAAPFFGIGRLDATWTSWRGHLAAAAPVRDPRKHVPRNHGFPAEQKTKACFWLTKHEEKAENKISNKTIGPTCLRVFDILKEFDMIKHDETRLMELMEGHWPDLSRSSLISPVFPPKTVVPHLSSRWQAWVADSCDSYLHELIRMNGSWEFGFEVPCGVISSMACWKIHYSYSYRCL